MFKITFIVFIILILNWQELEHLLNQNEHGTSNNNEIY